MEQSSMEQPKFTSPEEEIAFLRRELAERERSFERPTTPEERERLADDTVRAYEAMPAEEAIAPERRMSAEETEGIVLDLSPEEHDKTMEELLGFIMDKGLKNTLGIVEKMNNPHIADDFHRFLVQYVRYTPDMPDIRRDTRLKKALYMRLYEVTLPDIGTREEGNKPFKEIISAMEQFYAGMMSVSEDTNPLPGKDFFSIEIAQSDARADVVFYVAVPTDKAGMFEKHMEAVFPAARIEEQKDDYNIFNEHGTVAGAWATPTRSPVFPIKTYDAFDHDPLDVLLNVFSKLKKDGEGAAVQLVVSPAGEHFVKRYGKALDDIRKGVPVKHATDIPRELSGEMAKGLKEVVLGKGLPKKPDESGTTQATDQSAIEQIAKKVESTIFDTNIRILASGETVARSEAILADLRSAFNQFTNAQGNGFSFVYEKGRSLNRLIHEYTYRTFDVSESFPLNLREMTSIMHMPAHQENAPLLKRAKAGTAPAPMELGNEGVVLGVNRYRGETKEIRMAPEDRLRHFYVIGQTGTGKTTLLKNMIVQDIKNGDGVCMIDPHGSDIQDILGQIPPERAKDVIYFDPAYTDRPMGLNMLEYDTRFPEQKTFVVNELLAIFKKLYGAVPESMGPAFEQYFRNATMLVIEDPATGNTLLDVSRVLADANFRRLKLSRCQNPIIVQFWREIAEKAGGEASLANIVPYITNKFDVFLANEIMRPIVAQEHSAFNFREVMDERKILLVNLSKGRLGDVNANLIGLIIVGKILMAALSRVDVVGKQTPPPFYLYIDEFQNITTDSISTILSEARKYKLSLTIAHQFIAQLEDNIRDAVFGNVGSLGVFRVGTEDAEFLEKQFQPVFSATDIIKIDNRNAYMKMLADGRPVKPFNMETLAPASPRADLAEKIKELSYLRFGRDRAEVTEEIMRKYRKDEA